MSKKVFIYNPDTCNYEPFRPKRSTQVIRTSLYFAFALLVAMGSLYYLKQELGTPKENRRKASREDIINRIELMDGDLDRMYNKLSNMTERDESIYRVILEAEQIPGDVREAGSGGSDKFTSLESSDVPHKNDILNNYMRLDKLKRQLYIQSLSFDELVDLAIEREKMWQSIPSIQPVDNKELRRLSTVFGMRFHPILKIMRPHYGLDFMAEKGTPVYATGNGVVKVVRYSTTFGNMVEIDHGYGYVTLYAHMSGFNVKPGDVVMRGQCIGFVGSTGLSVSSHLHYEVHKDGNPVNPIGFFQHELDEDAYTRLLNLAKRETVPLD